MTKFTKKWQNDFEKRYSQTMKDLQDLHKEYKEVCDSNPDSYISVYPKIDTVNLGECKTWSCSHFKENENVDKSDEHVNITLSPELGSFDFDFSSLDELIKFRNEVIDACDKFNRPTEKEPKKVVDECQELSDVSDEEWEEMEDKEFTVRVSRDCVQVWTMTVMAKNSCEAEKKAQSGEFEDDVKHDENDEITNYGLETYECID